MLLLGLKLWRAVHREGSLAADTARFSSWYGHGHGHGHGHGKFILTVGFIKGERVMTRKGRRNKVTECAYKQGQKILSKRHGML